MCNTISTSDWIQIIIAAITLFSVVSSIVIAVKTLRQNNKMIKDNSRAYIIFYIDYHPQTGKYYLVIKNFGNSIGKLKFIKINPNLDWHKTTANLNINSLTNSTNVLLAPGQKISSWFDFDTYPDKIFNVELAYETMEETYFENYQIDLSYLSNYEWLHSYAIDDNSKDYKQVLYKINNSILELSQKD